MNPEEKNKTHTGRCLCGSVRYLVEGIMRNVINCHCKQCQSTHGNFAAYAATNKSSLKLIDDSGLKWYQSSDHARRGFCQNCGASLFWESLNKDHVCISAGTLDRPTYLTTVRHVFIAEAGDYYKIDDNLEKFTGSMWENN